MNRFNISDNFELYNANAPTLRRDDNPLEDLSEGAGLNADIIERLRLDPALKHGLNGIFNANNTDAQFDMFVAVVAELFYMKACVDCIEIYDPIAARANAYLATLAYDLYVTSIILQQNRTDQLDLSDCVEEAAGNEQEIRVEDPFFSNFLQPATNEPILINLEVVRVQRPPLPVENITRREIPKEGRLTITDFIQHAFYFTPFGSPKLLQGKTPLQRMLIFASHVVYPFGEVCNAHVKGYYNYLDQTDNLFSVKSFGSKGILARIPTNGAERVAFQNARLRKAQEWSFELFQTLNMYQRVLTGDGTAVFNIRKFREFYAQGPKNDSYPIYNIFYDKAAARLIQATPFVKLSFLFNIDEKMLFDCFHPQKVNKSNITLLMNAASVIELSDMNLTLTNDTVENIKSFEKFLAKNMYLKKERERMREQEEQEERMRKQDEYEERMKEQEA